jgi:hypothetical protein
MSSAKKKHDDDDHRSHDDDDDGFHFPTLTDAQISTAKLFYYDANDLFLSFTHQQSVHIDAQLDPTGRDSGGHLFTGSGNNSTPMKVVDNNHADVELALGVAYRTGDSIHSSFTDFTGATHYNVPAGQQVLDPAHNVSSNASNRAAWKVDFSVDSALDGSTKHLDQFDFKMLLDTDPTGGVNFKELHLAASATAPDGYVWLDSHGVAVIDDGKGNPAHPGQVNQNSMNLDFGYWGGATAPNAIGSHFDVILTAENHSTHQVLAVDHIVLDVTAHIIA